MDLATPLTSVTDSKDLVFTDMRAAEDMQGHALL